MKTLWLIRIDCVFLEDYRIKHSSGHMLIQVRHTGGLTPPNKEYGHVFISPECITRLKHMSWDAMTAYRREGLRDVQM